MLTILNIINYFSGRPLPFYVLILITISIYYYVMTNYWENIVSNKLYLIINVILLLIDITAIIMIYTIPSDNQSNEIPTIKNKKKKKNKESKLNEQPKQIELPIQIVEVENKLSNLETKNNDNNKSILSLYEPEKDVSINTYNK